MKIGFIGMGIMGKPMAINLVKAGYDVMVSNRNMEKCQPAVEAGAKAGSYTELAENCDVIITMLPNGPQVKEVILGEGAVAAHMKPGSVLIDMSSINPVDSKEIAAALAAYGVEMLDAPVSGGEPKAIDGTLSVMAGGKQEVFDKYKEMLGIKAQSSADLITSLSGGNQQKIFIARWLNTDAGILILDNPTQGIDVGAKAEIYRLILELARAGKTILINTLEIPEIMKVADRCIVFYDGRMIKELAHEEINEQDVMLYSVGVTQKTAGEEK